MQTEHATVRPCRRFRWYVGPWIDRLARALGSRNYRTRRTEYVGTVDIPIGKFEEMLRDGGFRWDPASLYHRTPAGTTTEGSWVLRDSPLADRQLHVVLYAQARDRVDVYAHDEYNWVRHPVKHARQEDIRRKQGSARMRTWLDERGIDYDHEPLVVRKLVRYLELVSRRFRLG